MNYIDKDRLIGACVRLDLSLDADRLTQEVTGIATDEWFVGNRSQQVHSDVDAIFLRGYAPREGNKPINDRDILNQLPYISELIHQQIPAPPLRCLLARLAPCGSVKLHADNGVYFRKTLRLHIPVVTSPEASMYCSGHFYRMQSGEVWALNNIGIHGVLNEHASIARTHIICDFQPTPELLGLIAAGQSDLGVEDPAAYARLQTASDSSSASPSKP